MKTDCTVLNSTEENLIYKVQTVGQEEKKEKKHFKNTQNTEDRSECYYSHLLIFSA